MTDVIIIGGGIAGCSTAWYLAADGVGVVLLEQADLSNGASGANAGSLHVQIQPEPYAKFGESWARQFAPAIPFYLWSMTLWDEAEFAVDSDMGVRRAGGLTIAANDAELRRLGDKAALERAAGLAVEVLDRAELSNLAPYVADDAAGALFCPAEGMADPLRATTAFAAAAERAGARILRGQEVRGIEHTQTGFRVLTSGATFTAPRVVNAAGMHAGRIAAMVGGSIDSKSFPIQVGVTEPLAPTIRHLVYSCGERLTLKQTHAGTVLIGGGWPAVVGTSGVPQVSETSLAGNVEAALRAVPALATARIVRVWAAWVNGNNSWLPVIGELPEVPGFFVNYVPWMGFSGSPAAGRIVACLVQGRTPPVDFDLSAFLPVA